MFCYSQIHPPLTSAKDNKGHDQSDSTGRGCGVSKLGAENSASKGGDLGDAGRFGDGGASSEREETDQLRRT